MELDEMKTSWQKACATAGTEEKLHHLISTRRHLSVARRVRVKLLTEAVFMALLLFFFYDIFDGHRKPVYASIALVIGSLFYFLSNLLSHFRLQELVRATTIKTSLQKQLAALKQIRVVSLAAMLLFSLALMLFFTSAVVFDAKKLLLLVVGVVVFVVVQVYLSGRMWQGWINRIEQLLQELKE